MWISALVTIANLVLAAAVGLRLLARTRRRDGGPEVWLAGYFLCGALLSAALSISVYASLGRQGVGIGPTLASRLLGASVLLACVAGACIYAFTWRTFRRGEAWALALVIGGSATLAGAWLSQWLRGEFSVRVVPTASAMVERMAYVTAFAWAAVESFRYHRLMARRQTLGLAEPAVVDRFRLWGLWASTTALLALAEFAARLVYYWRTGETERVLVDQALPIIAATVAVTSLLGAFAAVTLWLTFFPPQRYLRWLAARASMARPTAG